MQSAFTIEMKSSKLALGYVKEDCEGRDVANQKNNNARNNAR